MIQSLLPRCNECRRSLAMRKLSVRPYVRPSVVCQTCELWQNERKIGPDFYTTRKIISLVFSEEEWLVGATPSTWNFGSNGPVEAKSPIMNRYSLVAPQPEHLAKKVQLTLIGSPLRAFQWA